MAHLAARDQRAARGEGERERKKVLTLLKLHVVRGCWKKKEREEEKKNFTAETHPGRLGLNKKNLINREEVYFEIKQEGGRWGGNEMNEGVNEGNLPDTAQ